MLLLHKRQAASGVLRAIALPVTIEWVTLDGRLHPWGKKGTEDLIENPHRSTAYGSIRHLADVYAKAQTTRNLLQLIVGKWAELAG
jgi:hypothetical protein